MGLVWMWVVVWGLSIGTGSGDLLAQDIFDHPDPRRVGAWETVIPSDSGAAVNRVLGMQAVHAVLLPSGKILIASGSSWRNRAPIDYYPKDQFCKETQKEEPCAGQGVIRRYEDPFLQHKLNDYYKIVNNVAIYDPVANTFFRIPHPTPVTDPERESHFAPNDLFCPGHLHLPDGNVLFTGGTQYYYPYRTGLKATYIFDWKQEMQVDWRQFKDWAKVQEPGSKFYPWVFSGFMVRGRWYPHMLPLLDGRLVIFGGFVGFEEAGAPMPYQFEINTFVEFFDATQFDAKNPANAWRALNVAKLKNSPFNTPLDMSILKTYLIDRGFLREGASDAELKAYIEAQCRERRCKACNTKPCTSCIERCVNAQYYDAFKLYPNNYLLNDGRIYLTREGEWVSARTDDTVFMRRTKFTYFMEVGGTRAAPAVAFSMGPLRPDIITSYGTSFRSPTSGHINILGGQPTSAGTLAPIHAEEPTQFLGGRGSRKLETYHVPASATELGSWSLQEDFLGTEYQDDRTMHYAIILPTKQILVVNGANYDFDGAIYYPILMTPKPDGGYTTQRMSEAVAPRLYHNTALLLPDARVLVLGGNSARATIHMAREPINPNTPSPGQYKPNFDATDLDMYFYRDGHMAKVEKGQLTVPTELWGGEIYSPPYLFIDGGRRPEIVGLHSGGTATAKQEGIYYELESRGMYTLALKSLPSSCSIGNGDAVVLIKLPAATHGWDSGQRLIDVSYQVSGSTAVEITAPAREADNVPPGFYMLFYVDCMGVPSKAQMVQFDVAAVR
ncbi:hypothetical protein C2W62_25705 [Candidatus Entotheonella serta]|nr:hypothetical protein C2W62_25705 [Candidatus Entotheonella serta]